ncbi:protein of unknown function DUF86 [Pyrobaculum arsenaticum DSM 13514]|uniref:DUF86 domain-containing protein n=2 Tax=Pyrobaculum arsenaticum TaxID=121277 RepID=A4WJN7_PYRAR|nr:protein of unknown function DUF86 [Pyrobaculum arsenaticum DSM 13514]
MTMDKALCLALLQKASEAKSAVEAALRITSRSYDKLTDEEIWALRYQLIVLVEALASLCMKLARGAWGVVYTTYRECLLEADRRLGAGCGETLGALVGLRNLLVHRYFQVDDRRVYDAVKKDFKCVLDFLEKALSHASCV